MARQEKMLAKKRGRPAIGAGKTVGVRFQPDDLAALDGYVAAGDPMSRPQAIRAIVADWLRTHGFKPTGTKPTGPATDAVEAMDEALEADRRNRRR